MEIRITTFDTLAAFHLLEQQRVTLKDTAELGPGILARYEGTYIRKSVGLPEIATFALTVSSGIALNVAANAIWDWIKGLRTPPESITIDRQEVEFEEGAIKRVVIEHIEKRRGRAA
jgi:hypothetical protein